MVPSLFQSVYNDLGYSSNQKKMQQKEEINEGHKKGVSILESL
jgi:hypothetical protein